MSIERILTKLEVNIYENKSRHYEHIYFVIKLYENKPGYKYENKPGYYKHIYFNIKLYENKSGHYCNLLDSYWVTIYTLC